LAQVIAEAQVPAGVVNFVFGRGPSAGEALVKHPQVPLISFTGGTATGKRIYRESAEHFKKLSLELGGKNPNLIFADCDFDKAIEGSIRSSFLNQGEICLCGSRIYVEKKIFDRFCQAFVAQVEKLRIGDPKDPENFLGALVSKEHLEKVLSYIQIAKAEGGKILTGGERAQIPGEFSQGYFLKPTVITDLKENSRCIQEEIFGPVVTISYFDSEQSAIEMANGVSYGLSATLWTEDKVKAKRIAEQLHVGTVWINSWLLRDLRVPFGGMKHSGLGREGGHYSRDFFTEATTVVEGLI
jgi:aminomuconate-semialdehyde/2-hydroxymuconate-6-semialdehyde dehydrogenase